MNAGLNTINQLHKLWNVTVTIVTIVCIVHIVYQLLSQNKTSQDLSTSVQVFSVCSIQIYYQNYENLLFFQQ